MNSTLRKIAENIVTHLEATGGTRKAHGEREADVALVADILLQSLTHEGFVQIVSPSGLPSPPSGGPR